MQLKKQGKCLNTTRSKLPSCQIKAPRKGENNVIFTKEREKKQYHTKVINFLGRIMLLYFGEKKRRKKCSHFYWNV